MGDVIDFKSRKKAAVLKLAYDAHREYRLKIERMNKLELLEEMVQFQERRAKLGKLTPAMMTDGIVLFGALERNAETPELRSLTSSYRRHLECELQEVGK